jgi:hypothetical protein
MKSTYVMVPKKLVVTAVIAYVCLVIGVILSVQWASYVDRRSNQRLCGVITISNDIYRTSPPPSDVKKKLSTAMEKLQSDYKCKET